ncbi:MAG: SprB repeat-containing protein [Lewinellaceae bacterium]|nr:SprB repeat-containing protein [Lewinellaceae bacterium]
MHYSYNNAFEMKKGHFLQASLLFAILLLSAGSAWGQSLQIQIAAISGACNGNNGTITVTATGGTSPYAYAWNTGATGPFVSGLAPGTYTVTATDAIGTTGSLGVEVSAVDSLQVSLLLTKAQCPGVNNGTATAVVTPSNGNFSFAWNVPGSPNSPQITGLAAGTTVCVTVTDLNSGCSGVACGKIIAHNQLQVVVDGLDATCIGTSDGSASAMATQGTPLFTFVWNLGNTTLTDSSNSSSTITGLAPGIYTVSVSDANGCTTIGAASIGASGLPHAAIDSLVISCDPDSNLVTLQLSDLSTVPAPWAITSWFWQVSWSTGFTTFNVQNPPALVLPGGEAGIIKLVVETSTGCSDSLSIPYTLPTPPQIAISVEPDGFACPGTSATITLTGSQDNQYVWSPTAYLDLSNGPFEVVANPPGTTTYTVTATQGVCTTIDSVTIIRPPAVAIDLPGGSATTCSDSVTLTLVPNGPMNVVWLNAQNDTLGNTITIQLPVDSASTYIVFAVDTFGCVTSDTATITSQGVNVSVDVPSPSVFCPGQPVNLSASGSSAGGAIQYNWTSPNPNVQIIGGNSPNITIQAPAGMHTVQLIASNDFCADTVSASFNIRPAVEIELPGGSATVCSDSITLTLAPIGPLNLVWVNDQNDTWVIPSQYNCRLTLFPPTSFLRWIRSTVPVQIQR